MSNILLSYPSLLTTNLISFSHSIINSTRPFSFVVLLLLIVPSTSETDVNAVSIGLFVLESKTTVSSSKSHKGLIFFKAYISSFPTPPVLFDET